MMAHGNRMIDWEGLAQQHIAEIRRALPEPIRARATEVPVFFSRASNEKSGTYLDDEATILDAEIERSDSNTYPIFLNWDSGLLNVVFESCSRTRQARASALRSISRSR